MEYYSAIKKKKIIPFTATWMELETLILSEVSLLLILYTLAIWHLPVTAIDASQNYQQCIDPHAWNFLYLPHFFPARKLLCFVELIRLDWADQDNSG